MAASNGVLFAPRASQSAPAAAKPQERTRLYKDFLTPALHRRFTSSAGIVLAACWLASILIGTNSHIFWSWFPIGAAGVRAILLLIPCMAVFIVRVANMHVGERTANGPALAALAAITQSKSLGSTLHTVGWYMWSGWFFGEVYMWSSKPEDSLGMIDLGRTYERARLNENPIFLRCLFVLLGLIQATRHLAVDYDQIAIPTWIDDAASQKPEQASSGSNASASLLSKLPPTLQLLAGRSTGIAHRALKLTVVGILFVTLPVYFLVLRRTVWSWTYMVGRAFYGQLPPSAPPTGLLNFGRLAWQAFFGAFLLALLWEFSNATFAVYVAQPPLKKGQPLTNEIKDVRGVLLHRSKDPNGSLITGLKSKREVPRTFAFWELYIICTQFEVRRKTIFIEVDRSGGSTWRQVCDQCLAEISKISQRINSVDDYGRRIVSAPKPQELAGDANAASIGLPKIANHGIQDRPDMFLKPKKDLAQAVGTFAKSIGQSPTSHNPVASIQRSAEQILPKEQRQRIVQDQFAQANSYAVKFLQMPVGEAFRQTFAYRASAVTFGTPHSNRVTVIYAVRALTKLAVCSLTEAQYGGVSKDIPVIIRTLTAAIRSMERFTRTLKPDWTDVLFSERDREVADIRQVLEVIKAGLEEIVLAFGEYAGELGLSKMEVREARDASTRKAITSGGVAGAAETKRLPSNSGERVEMVQRRRG